MAPVVSPQFGVKDQTDVFNTDQQGDLTVRWVTGKGSWDGPRTLSSNLLPPNALLAAGEQVGAGNQTDVIGISKNGKQAIAWVNGDSDWNGPLEILSSEFVPGSSVATSPQFGVPNQTDVFAVNHGGDLTVSWITGSGTWDGPTPIAQGFKSGQTFVAASRRFGQDRTDVYAVRTNGALTVTSVEGKGSWETEEISPPGTFVPGSALVAGPQYGLRDQTDVWGVDKQGALTVTWFDSTKWNGPRRISDTNTFPPGASVATGPQTSDQTDVFAVDQRGRATVSWVTKDSEWDGPSPIGDGFQPGARLAAHPQLGAKDQLDVFIQGRNGEVNVFWVTGTGSWSGPVII